MLNKGSASPTNKRPVSFNLSTWEVESQPRQQPTPPPPIPPLTDQKPQSASIVTKPLNTTTNPPLPSPPSQQQTDMASKDLDIEMMETKAEKKSSNKIKRTKSKHASKAAQDKSNADLRAAYEHQKAMIPVLMRWNNITFYLSMFGIVLTLAEIELSRHYYKNANSIVPLIIKIVMTTDSILCCLALIKYWTAKVEIFRGKELVHKTATVWNTKKFRNELVLELIVVAFHVPPYVDQLVGFVYGDLHFNALGVLVLLRLYIVPRYMKQAFKKQFVTHKVRLIGAINRVPFNSFFVTKAMLNLNPYRLLVSFLLLFVLVIAYTLTQVEINIPSCSDPLADQDRCHPAGVYFWQWVVFSFALILGIEPTTVPMSILGQIVTICGAMVGTCLVAILIAVIADSLTLSTTESRVVDQIRSHTLSKDRKKQAVRFIQSYWRWLVAIKKRLPPSTTVRESGMLHGETNNALVKLTRADRRHRENLVVSMHEWRQSKRKGAQESQLTSISKDVSTVIDEMTHVKSSAMATEKQVDAMTLKLNETLSNIDAKLDALMKSIGGGSGGTTGSTGSSRMTTNMTSMEQEF